MARKRFSDEDILKVLRQVEVDLSSGNDIKTACRRAGISDATYYNWRKRYGGIWRREGLKVPMKQPKRGRLWFNDGSCIRLRAERPNHVWSYDFVQDRTHDGVSYRMLCVIDEYTRECLAIRVERKLNSQTVLEVLAELFLTHGPPEHIRSDNGLS